MGCGSSTGGDGKIQMQKTQLPGMDEFFDDAQGFIDEIYTIQDPIDDALDKLIYNCDFEKTVGANAHHCAVGVAFSMAAQANGADIDNLFDIKPEAPFLTFNKGSATGKTADAVDDLTDYIKALVDAKDRVIPLGEKAKGFAEKAPDLPGKAKDDLGNAKGLGAMAKIKAVKNTASNSKNLAKLPGMVKGLTDCIKEALASVQGATKELNAKKGQLADIGKKCAEKNLTSPKDCYLAHGDPIEASAAAKKKHAEVEKKKKAKAKAAAKGGAKK